MLRFICLMLLVPYQTSGVTYKTEQRGSKYTENYFLYFQLESGEYISPWHDIPLHADSTNQSFNLVVEIPRFSQAKFEINRDETLNPIKQDEKNGKPRYLANVFPLHGHICNYGAFPQTWENPYKTDQWTGLAGDKDPLDVCEIGFNPISTGSVVPVRVLGVLGLLDNGETDWKVIVMNSTEAEEKNINSLADLDSTYPLLPEIVREFYRVYKIPDGASENKFAFDGEIRDEDFAKEVIRYTNEHWKEMVANSTEHGTSSCANTQNMGSPCLITQQEMKSILQDKPGVSDASSPLPPLVDRWSYVDLRLTLNQIQTSSAKTDKVSVLALLLLNSRLLFTAQ